MELLVQLISPDDFMPHGYCYLWNPGLVWLHVISDTLIALAYLSIPITLIYFARKKRGLPFHWMFLCFGIFIVACGGTHLMEVWNLWHGNYWLAGILKAITALASIVTAALLVSLIPKGLALPTNNDLRQANESLVSLSERLSLATAVAKVGVWDWDLAGNTATWDATMFEIYGFPFVNPVPYEKWTAAVYPVDFPTIEATLRKLVDEKAQGSADFRITLADGAVRDLTAIARAVMDPLGNVTRVIGVSADITERNRAEEALRASEEQFRQIAENIREVFFIVAPVPARVVYISPAYDEIWGRSGHELYDRPLAWIEGVHADDRKRAGAFFTRCIEGIQSEEEYRVVRPDGSLRWIHARSFPILDSKDKFVRAVGIAEDITERQRVLDELRSATTAAEEANRVKGEFLANMSHELRTPLNGILGMTELVLDSELTLEQRKFLTMAKFSADSLLTVIDDILDFSKIEAGKLDFESIEFDFRGAFEVIMKISAIRAHEKDLKLIWDVRPEVPGVLVGDPSRLRQIIINLVGNAIKFTERGEVRVEVQVESADPENTLLHFSVADSGIGIPLEKQAAIFDAFTQADGSTARRYGGSGLGLTISRRLVEIFGGRLWLDSMSGGGSTFHFTARFGVVIRPPFVGHASPELAASSLPVARHSAHHRKMRLRILLAEDNRVNQIIVVRLMEKRGHSVEVAADGREALEKLRGDKFELVLMDVQMPRMGGFEAAAAIREMEKTQGGHLPIIAMTAHAMKGDRERCLAAGMDGYISKPFRIDELLKEIESITQLSFSNT
jgi:PAS domain S-box-containing protein